jgi:ATP-dependent protease ClpP protease subunit
MSSSTPGQRGVGAPDMKRDRFFKPDETVEYGLIDGVITSH